MGAYPAASLSGKITWKVTQPSTEAKSDEEQAQREKIQALMERIKKTTEKSNHLSAEAEKDSPKKEN